MRAPLRITLGGGGTDLPSWYEEHGGFLISASINKYIYLTGSKRPFDQKIWLSYSDVEICDTVDEIKHDIFAECLKKYYRNGGIEIHSISEVTGGSGLGSSGTFTVALLKLLHKLDNTNIPAKELAELACHIEMIDLNGACGKQDQYIAAHGGIVSMEIDKSGEVKTKRLELDSLVLKRLQRNLLIYHTGVSRKASEILKDQSENISSGNLSYHDGMKHIQEIGYTSLECLNAGKLDDFGLNLHEHWKVKKLMSNKMTNTQIDGIYDFGVRNGALGGKVMGAGGGGFFLFYVQEEKQREFREKMLLNNLNEMDWSFEFQGATQIYSY